MLQDGVASLSRVQRVTPERCLADTAYDSDAFSRYP